MNRQKVNVVWLSDLVSIEDLGKSELFSDFVRLMTNRRTTYFIFEDQESFKSLSFPEVKEEIYEKIFKRDLSDKEEGNIWIIKNVRDEYDIQNLFVFDFEPDRDFETLNSLIIRTLNDHGALHMEMTFGNPTKFKGFFEEKIRPYAYVANVSDVDKGSGKYAVLTPL